MNAIIDKILTLRDCYMNPKEIVDSVINRVEIMLSDKNNISVSDVEKISGYSKRYIQRIFKNITGMNISTYVKKEVNSGGYSFKAY